MSKPFVVRIPPGEKGPRDKGWQSAEEPFEVPAGWNFGYRLDGLTVVDCDAPGAIEWWEQHGPPTPYVSESRPGRRAYWYSGEATGPGAYHWSMPDGTRAGEVRVGNKVQCVAPGSVHPEAGTLYRWLGAALDTVNQAPEFPPAALPPAASGQRVPGLHKGRKLVTGAPDAVWGVMSKEWCPANPEHRSEGLDFGVLEDGRLTPHCQAGCARDAVIAALVAEGRHTREELWPPDGMAVQPWDVEDECSPEPTKKTGRFKRAADIAEEQVTWLWDARIPFGKVTLLGGDPEGGKTFAMLDLAAAITRGDSLPGDAREQEPGDVVFVSYEDGAGDTLVPRARRMGADLTRLHFVTGADLTLDDNSLLTSDRIVEIEEEILGLDNVKLLVVDPLGSFVGGETETGLDNKVRAALAATVALAERVGIAVVVLAHMNKSAGKAIYRINGSIGFVGLVRSVLVAGEYEGRRGLAVGKNNLAERAPTIEYRIEDLDGPGTRSGVVRWGDEMPGVDADMLVSTQAAGQGPRVKGVAPDEAPGMVARGWLAERLNGRGWVPASDLEDEVREEQPFSWTSVKRAKSVIGVETRRVPGQHGGASEWRWAGSVLAALTSTE